MSSCLRSPSRRLAAFLLAVLFLAACARPPGHLPEMPRRKRTTLTLPHLGYTLQAGAFIKVEHAARFSESLQRQGLEAAYYHSDDGMYRVRFGDFASKAKAQARGEALRSAGVIDAFWVVAPERPAAEPIGGVDSLQRDERGLRADLVKTARSYLGVPYLFGGTKDQGFDCSGLTGAVYQINGLRLPRTSRAQFEAGNPIELEKAQPGDLVFFGLGGSSRVSHVGMVVAAGIFIHAPRTGQGIRQDDLSEPYYQKHFLGARSYL